MEGKFLLVIPEINGDFLFRHRLGCIVKDFFFKQCVDGKLAFCILEILQNRFRVVKPLPLGLLVQQLGINPLTSKRSYLHFRNAVACIDVLMDCIHCQRLVVNAGNIVFLFRYARARSKRYSNSKHYDG